MKDTKSHLHGQRGFIVGLLVVQFPQNGLAVLPGAVVYLRLSRRARTVVLLD